MFRMEQVLHDGGIHISNHYTSDPCNYVGHVLNFGIVLTKKNIEQERPLGQRKTRPQTNTFCDIQMVVILLLANISIPSRYPTTETLVDLDFDLSRSVNVKFDNAIGFAI